MPRKKFPRKKRNFVRNRRKKYGFTSKLGRPSRPLKESVYLFKRRRTEVVNVNNTAGSNWIPTDDNGIARSWAFALTDLPNYTDFTNLFSQYKILAVKAEIFFCNSSVGVLPAGTMSNLQMLAYAAPNRTGQIAHGNDEVHFLECQASTRRCCYVGSAKPLKYYMKVNQLSERYNSAVNTDYAVVKPRYVSTNEPDSAHYGLDCHIRLVNGTAMGSNVTQLKTLLTYYIACRGVQ